MSVVLRPAVFAPPHASPLTGGHGVGQALGGAGQRPSIFQPWSHESSALAWWHGTVPASSSAADSSDHSFSTFGGINHAALTTDALSPRSPFRHPTKASDSRRTSRQETSGTLLCTP